MVSHEQPPRPDQEPHKPEVLQRLEARWSEGNLVCVGLDSDYSQLPEEFKTHLKSRTQAVFNQAIVRATADSVCAYKPNMAFYEAEGEDGFQALKDTINFIHADYPEIPVILDAKRADIGNTNRGYARMAFEQLGADALTVSPYLGSSFLKNGERKLESLSPFLEQRDKLIFVLCRTSNPDAGEFQDLPVVLNGVSQEYKAKFGHLNDLAHKIDSNIAPLYLVLAHKLARDWNVNGNVGLVVGATYPEELGRIRRVVGDMPILIPGLGAQAGEAEATVKAGKDSRNQGMVINSSRGIIFASSGEDYAEAARAATQKLHDQINRYRLAT